MSTRHRMQRVNVEAKCGPVCALDDFVEVISGHRTTQYDLVVRVNRLTLE